MAEGKSFTQTGICHRHQEKSQESSSPLSSPLSSHPAVKPPIEQNGHGPTQSNGTNAEEHHPVVVQQQQNMPPSNPVFDITNDDDNDDDVVKNTAAETGATSNNNSVVRNTTGAMNHNSSSNNGNNDDLRLIGFVQISQEMWKFTEMEVNQALMSAYANLPIPVHNAITKTRVYRFVQSGNGTTPVYTSKASFYTGLLQKRNPSMAASPFELVGLKCDYCAAKDAHVVGCVSFLRRRGDPDPASLAKHLANAIYQRVLHLQKCPNALLEHGDEAKSLFDTQYDRNDRHLANFTNLWLEEWQTFWQTKNHCTTTTKNGQPQQQPPVGVAQPTSLSMTQYRQHQLLRQQLQRQQELMGQQLKQQQQQLQQQQQQQQQQLQQLQQPQLPQQPVPIPTGVPIRPAQNNLQPLALFFAQRRSLELMQQQQAQRQPLMQQQQQMVGNFSQQLLFQQQQQHRQRIEQQRQKLELQNPREAQRIEEERQLERQQELALQARQRLTSNPLLSNHQPQQVVQQKVVQQKVVQQKVVQQKVVQQQEQRAQPRQQIPRQRPPSYFPRNKRIPFEELEKIYEDRWEDATESMFNRVSSDSDDDKDEADDPFRTFPKDESLPTPPKLPPLPPPKTNPDCSRLLQSHQLARCPNGVPFLTETDPNSQDEEESPKIDLPIVMPNDVVIACEDCPDAMIAALHNQTGNRGFLRLVSDQRCAYQDASSDKKELKIIRSILDRVAGRNGTFVKIRTNASDQSCKTYRTTDQEVVDYTRFRLEKGFPDVLNPHQLRLYFAWKAKAASLKRSSPRKKTDVSSKDAKPEGTPIRSKVHVIEHAPRVGLFNGYLEWNTRARSSTKIKFSWVCKKPPPPPSSTKTTAHAEPDTTTAAAATTTTTKESVANGTLEIDNGDSNKIIAGMEGNGEPFSETQSTSNSQVTTVLPANTAAATPTSSQLRNGDTDVSGSPKTITDERKEEQQQRELAPPLPTKRSFPDDEKVTTDSPSNKRPRINECNETSVMNGSVSRETSTPTEVVPAVSRTVEKQPSAP